MAFRIATPEETEAWLGSGVVILGWRHGEVSQVDTPSVATAPEDANSQSQALPLLTGQEQHDQNLAAMSEGEIHAMVRKLATLARSKLGSVRDDDEFDSFNDGQ